MSRPYPADERHLRHPTLRLLSDDQLRRDIARMEAIASMPIPEAPIEAATDARTKVAAALMVLRLLRAEVAHREGGVAAPTTEEDQA